MEALSEILSRVQPLHRGKDALVSRERRLVAQQALNDGDLDKALALASQAVLRASATGGDDAICDGGISLALSLWLRSEILLRCDKPRAALEHLPAKMRAQYYWRMGHCCRGASLIGGAKQNMSSLSKQLKITEEDNKGRFVVANAPVSTGDVLLVDTPYAACLVGDFYGTHCLHCFERCPNMSCSGKFRANLQCLPSRCAKCSINIDRDLVKINMETVNRYVKQYQYLEVLVQSVLQL